MATVRNVAGEQRYIPLVDQLVEDGETFEVDDDVFDTVSFSPDVFEVVAPPSKSKPVDKADTKVKE